MPILDLDSRLPAIPVEWSDERPEIREITGEAEREVIYRLRYEVYVEEMARPVRHANHASRRIVDPLDADGRLLGAFTGSRAVGTARLNFSAVSKFDPTDFYRLSGFNRIYPGRVCLVTKLMIVRDLRRSRLFLQLAQRIVSEAAAGGARVILIDCNDPVLPIFRKLGFIAYDRAEHPEYGNVTLMALFFEDVHHLERVRSPFYQILKKGKIHVAERDGKDSSEVESQI